MLTDVLWLVSYVLRRANVGLHLDLDDSLPLVQADRIQIEQVMLNLIRNAVDAMNNIAAIQHTLSITTRCNEQGQIEARFADTGEGLTEEAAERVFDAFYTTKAAGTGVGLAISRTIAEAHSGKLRVESNEAGGATFVFLLPKHESTES